MMGKIVLAVGVMLLITGCVGVALASHGDQHHCGPWIGVDESTIDLGAGLGELPRATFLVVGPGEFVENEYDEQGNKVRMRACARPGESGVGWSVCYRSRDVNCWGRYSTVVSSQPSLNSPAPQSRPLILNGPGKVMYQENSVDPVATFTTAPDNEQELHWRLGGVDAQVLSMSDDGVVRFRSPPDFENPGDRNGDGMYEIRARVSDNGSTERTDSSNLIVVVTPVNELSPVNGNTEVSIPEGYTGALARYEVVDPEDDSVTWSLDGPDAVHFHIDREGNLSLNNAMDFEAPSSASGTNVHSLQVTAVDDGIPQIISILDVLVKVSNVNELGSVNGDTEVSILEGYTGFLARYEVVDPEEDTVIWSLDGPDAVHFHINREGNLSLNNAMDFEAPSSASGTNVHSLTVTAVDDGIPQITSILDVLVEVSNVNESPQVSEMPDLELTVGEGPVTLNLDEYFTDPDGDELTYALVGTSDGDVASPVVDEDILSITPIGAGSLLVGVSGTDAGGLLAIASANVTVMLPEPVRYIDPTLDYDIVVMPIVSQYADPAYGNLRAAVEAHGAVSYLEQDVGGNSDTTSGPVPSISPRLLPPATPSPTVAPLKDEISMPPASSIPSSTDGSFSTPSPEATQAASAAVSSPGTMEPKESPVVKDSVSPTERDKSAPDPATAASETADDEGFSLWLIVLLFVLGLLALALIRTRVIRR